jgi:thioredoxin 1
MKGKNMSEHIEITNANFEEEVLKSPIPVLLDFWAPWCGPCRMIAPVIEELAREYSGKIKVGKVNVDEEGELATKHGIISIPTMVVYHGGNIANQKVGALPKQEIEGLFKNLI